MKNEVDMDKLIKLLKEKKDQAPINKIITDEEYRKFLDKHAKTH